MIHYHRERENASHLEKKSVKYKGKLFDITAADGKTLFAAAHPPVVSGDDQCNCFSDAFSADALGRMESVMHLFRGDNDNILDVAPDTILIPEDPDLKQAVFAAIGADKDPATSSNAFNYQFGRWNVRCWTYLNQYLVKGSAFPWVLLDEAYNQEYGGAAWFDRVELEIRSEIADNDANRWKGYARFGAGFNDWRFIAAGGIDGADAL